MNTQIMTETSIKIPASVKPEGKATFVMLGTGFDEIEAIAPVDVMRRAGMEVYTVSMTENRLVRGATGNNIVADMTVADLNPSQIDWLVFPGADKSEAAVNLDKELQNIVTAHWENGGKIAAICAAPAPAFSNSVFSPLSFSGNAVGGRAASGKRRGRHCHYQTLPRCAMTSPAVVPLWSLYF